jgi:hypothetical protein
VAKAKHDDPKQTAAFRKAARELGADESKEGFQTVLRKVAKAKAPLLATKKDKRV